MTRATAVLLSAAALAFSATDDPLKTLRTSHPRLIALNSDIERVRTLMQQHPQARKIHADLVKEAEKLLTTAPVEYKPGPRPLAQSRRVLDRVYTLALLYRLDGKPQYLERAVRELHAAAAFKDWDPSHFLDTAEMTHAFAIGYDWLYPALSSEDRAWMRAAIAEKGLDPAIAAYEHQAPWVTGRFNWNIVCNGGIAIGALAIADEEPERSRGVLRYALESFSRALSSYPPDGGWPEGPGFFWHHATSYAVSLLAALDSSLGTDFGLSAAKGFDKAGRFRVYFSGPAGKTFNYADAHDRTEPAPEMFWLAQRFAEPVYAWEEQRLLEAGGNPDALDLIWFQPEARSPKQQAWPLQVIFPSVQAAFLRSAWEDPNAIFLGVKGGDNKFTHGHLDLGSFVLDAGGVRWALDLGPDFNNFPGFPGKPRWPYFRMSTEAHNTVVIDEDSQDPRAEASITNHLFSPDLSWVEIDLTHAYRRRLRQFRRKIGIVERQQVFTQDVLESEQPVEAVWGMTTDADVSLSGQTAELKKNGWTLSAEILIPRHAVFDLIPALPGLPQDANAGLKKLVVRLGEKATEMDLKVSLTPHRTGQPKPKLTKGGA